VDEFAKLENEFLASRKINSKQLDENGKASVIPHSVVKWVETEQQRGMKYEVTLLVRCIRFLKF